MARRWRPNSPAPSSAPAPTASCCCRPIWCSPSRRDWLHHVEAVCKATSLGVIVYNRDNAILTEDTIAQLCERCPNLVGFKDGVGDIEQMTRIHLRMGDRLTYVGGLPTAETFALPYLEMGVTTYSSAVFNFVPEFSTQILRGGARGATAKPSRRACATSSCRCSRSATASAVMRSR